MNEFQKNLGNWIQIDDELNSLTIEDYGYDTGVITGTTGNHCVKCVAVNQCFFKDEENKKPEKFNALNINVLDVLIKSLVPGLYHFKCHCKEVPIQFFALDDIQLLIPPGKIKYLFSVKLGWVEAMGYHENDKEIFIKTLLQKTKESYYFGQYYKVNLTNYGFKINF